MHRVETVKPSGPCGQAQNGANLDFDLIFDLEGQGRSLHKTIDLNQVVLHLWSKVGDPSLNGSWIIMQTSKWLTLRLTHTQRHIDAGNDNTRRPKLALCKKRSDPINRSKFRTEDLPRNEAPIPNANKHAITKNFQQSLLWWEHPPGPPLSFRWLGSW